MRAWVISNGNIVDYGFFRNMISETDLIICADGGAKHAQKIGVTPDVIIGDLDSIEQHCYHDMIAKNIQIINYSTDKDETDTQLAVEYAIQRGCEEIILIGSLGSRFDHSFANVSLLKLVLDKGIKGRIINENNEIYLINDYIQLRGKVGEKLSLLPLTPNVSGITTKGLQYGLNNAQMKFGIPNGISNVFIKPEAEITIKEGLLLVIKARD
ncbi:MAG: thiamine pyrophosphokinae [Petroclostridium sp.]|nr:thiamine pyrophosphokinae [Petroclostridium sp.]